ncbi:hypothetical protein F3Y22_tig00012840pilonHSYRG00167 [Hibiscus syriacus]|uniref:Pentatricopeptide repeat-containing protein n=1 Tax=Hibiscus syriacus TaxID=106335 RepID=A0A6A3C6I1_HIBSY|nr:hypothetical protein F3Y22_tig00012840pilonHSYRG00167 [Hibiscus syriacus]
MDGASVDEMGFLRGCIPAILGALDSVKDLDEALKPWVTVKLWNEMSFKGIEPINSTYGTLIDVYGKGGMKQQALCWLGKLNKQGVEPDEVTMGIIVQLYKSDEFRKAEEFFKKWSLNGSLSMMEVKHPVLWEMAADYFAKIKEACLEPDPVSYRTLLYAYSIRQMVSEAEHLIHDMDERHLEIDQYTQSALTRMYIEAGMLEKSWLWFRRFHLAGNMSSEGYSANIDAFGDREHVSEAENIFLCCQERKSLTVLEFNVMIKADGIAKSYDKACFVKLGELGMAEGLYNEMIQSVSFFAYKNEGIACVNFRISNCINSATAEVAKDL